MSLTAGNPSLITRNYENAITAIQGSSWQTPMTRHSPLDGVVHRKHVDTLAVGHVSAGRHGDQIAQAHAEILPHHLHKTEPKQRTKKRVITGTCMLSSACPTETKKKNKDVKLLRSCRSNRNMNKSVTCREPQQNKKAERYIWAFVRGRPNPIIYIFKLPSIDTLLRYISCSWYCIRDASV